MFIRWENFNVGFIIDFISICETICVSLKQGKSKAVMMLWEKIM